MNKERFAEPRTLGYLGLAVLTVALALSVAACGSDPPDSSSPSAKPTPTASQGYIFVANGNGPDVLTFKANAKGDVAPSAVLKSTGKFSYTEGVAVVAGDIYASDEGALSIFEFPYAVSGTRDISPTATIANQNPGAIAVDAFSNFWVVEESLTGPEDGGGEVVEYAPGTNTLECTISYSGFVNPEGISIDPTTGNIWVSDIGQGVIPPTVFEFSVASGCPSTPTPIATLSGSSTTMQYPYAIAFDTSGNLWVADAGTYAATIGPDQVLEFSSSSLTGTGNIDVAPTDTITGSATKLDGPEGITIGPPPKSGSTGNVFVANEGAGTASTSSITVYSGSATGNAAPIQTIAGSNTGLNSPEQVWFFAPSPGGPAAAVHP